MKKLLGIILSMCMLSTFAFSVSAVTLPSSIKLAVTETETGAVADVIISGDYEGVSSVQAVVSFDDTKLTYVSTEYGTFNKWDTKKSTKVNDSTYIVKQAALTDTDSDFLTGADTKILSVKFNKSTKLAQGDIKLITSAKIGRTTYSSEVYCGAEKSKGIALDYSTFTAYTPDEPDKPSFVIPEDSEKTGENNGIVDINTNAETGAYSVKVTAPIGKKAVIYIDGVAQTGSEIAGTATKETTIKVAYEDVTDEVITYVVPMSSIYGAEDGIAAFGKGTIAEGVEYGIKFGGLKGEYKGITDYKFPATGNVGGIFGVEVKDAPAGDYTAQAYVGDAMGAAISFTK